MTPRPPSLGWALALAGAAMLLLLMASPAWLPDGPAAMVQYAFSFVCHQLPDRSPHLGGHPLALCHRCAGILLGLGIGIAAVRAVPAHVGWGLFDQRPLTALLLAGVPTAVDWLLGATGVWANTPLSRVATGLLFGLTAGVLVGRSLLQPPTQRLPSPSANLLA